MNGFAKLAAVAAVVFIGLGVLFAGSVIVGIWLEFEHPAIWKAIATTFVLFFLSGVSHSVAKGMTEKPKDKPWFEMLRQQTTKRVETNRCSASGPGGSQRIVGGFQSHRASPAAVAEFRYPHNHEQNL